MLKPVRTVIDADAETVPTHANLPKDAHSDDPVLHFNIRYDGAWISGELWADGTGGVLSVVNGQCEYYSPSNEEWEAIKCTIHGDLSVLLKSLVT